ncbi:MAG TPA: hypothetical protein VN179_08830 [Solirubrobacterales bacterium]|nr:hypothetical protein [Solirubrobacterales bacterium]
MQPPEPPVPPPGCRYVEAGRPGPVGNRLLIDRNVGGVGLRREGAAIVVYSPYNDKSAVVDCEGPQATVRNIDRVVYAPPGGGDPPRIAHQLRVDLSGGPFLPGASNDRVPGGREIEIFADFPREPPNKWSSIYVTGSDVGDSIRIGGLSGGRTGLNLDMRHDHYLYDADLIVSAARDAHFQLEGGEGRDHFGAAGKGREFKGPIRQWHLVVRGGGGRDIVYAGPQRDVIDGGTDSDMIHGREGNDRLTGGEGFDFVYGGTGDDQISGGSDEARPFHDHLVGGSGRDWLYSRDGNEDYVECGTGPDHAYVDAIDEWSRASCEKQHGPDFPLVRTMPSAARSATATAMTSRPIVYGKTQTKSIGPEGQRPYEWGGIYATSGGREWQLTNHPWDGEPNLSRDGSKIAFVRSGDVYAMEADGSRLRQLTSGPEIDSLPKVSPNGRYVVFERQPLQGETDLYIVSLAGGPERALATWPGDDHEAAFSPDGRAIVFVRGGYRSETSRESDELFSIRPSGVGLTRLTRTPQDERRPFYFARGIVFNRSKVPGGEDGLAFVYSMRRDGTDVRRLVAREPGTFIRAVSPNGRLLIFASAGTRGLWKKPLVAEGRRSTRARRFTKTGGGASYMVFSSDGRRVAYVSFWLISLDLATGRQRLEGDRRELEAPGSPQGLIGPVISW